MLHVVSLGLIPVPDGEGVGTCMGILVREGCGAQPLLSPSLSCTFCRLTLPNEEGASGVAVAQELPLCIFAPDLAKVPPAAGKGSAPGRHRRGDRGTARARRDTRPWGRWGWALSPPRYSLFCLDGVHRGHVVAGDVASGTRAQRPRLPPVPLPGQGNRERGGRGTDRQTDAPTVCLLTPHTAGPDPAVPHPSLLRAPRQSLGPQPRSSGGTKAQRHLPGLVCGCWGWQQVRGGLTCC